MFYWDPDPIAFTLPGIGLPIAWYGLLFVAGFWAASWVGRRLLATQAQETGVHRDRALREARLTMDQVAGWATVGCVAGARLVHCAAYDPLYYLSHPSSILALREGGLASHGGILGIVVALVWLARRKQLSAWIWFDLVGVVYALPALAIRLGNFVNQEIIGVPTGSQWGVLFGHPADRVTLVPRHPAQLYEALAYGLLGLVAWRVWKRGERLGTGVFAAWGLIGAFSVRFVLEWWKEEQAQWLPAGLTLGQWLSIPCILVGWWMLQRSRQQRILAR